MRVFATARDAKSLDDLATLGIETLSLTVDDEESVQLCFLEIEKRLGDKGLDYLVNNAYVDVHPIEGEPCGANSLLEVAVCFPT